MTPRLVYVSDPCSVAQTCSQCPVECLLSPIPTPVFEIHVAPSPMNRMQRGVYQKNGKDKN